MEKFQRAKAIVELRTLYWIVVCYLLLGSVVAQEQEYSPDGYPDVNQLIERIDAAAPRLEDPGEVLTLQESLEKARNSHPALNAQWAAVLAANSSLQQVWALYYPSASITVSNDIQDVFAFSAGGDDRLRTLLGFDQSPYATLAITQTVFDVGERKAKVESARQTLRSTFLDYEDAWITQAQKVESAYLGVVKQESLVAVSLLDLERNQLALQAAERQLKGGTKSLVDVTQAEIQLAESRSGLAAAQAELRNAWASLAQAVGVPMESISSRRLEPLLDLYVEVPPWEDSVRELETHPQILSYKAQALSSEATAKATRRSMGPNLGVSVNPQGFYDSGALGGLWEVELTLTIPIYDPTVGPQIDEAEAQVVQAVENAKNTRLELLQQLESAYSSHQGAREQVAASRRQTKLALLNFDLASKRYQAGLTDYTELLNALSFVSTAQEDLVNALADMRTAEISIAQTTGMAARYTKDYFRQKSGKNLIRDLHEDLGVPAEK